MNSKITVLVALIACAALFGAGSMYKSGKVAVCHVPFGSPMNTHTLEVPAQAVQGHLDHGDYLGECKYNPNSNHD